MALSGGYEDDVDLGDALYVALIAFGLNTHVCMLAAHIRALVSLG